MLELINKINEARNKLKGFKNEVNLVLTKRELEYLYIHRGIR